MSYKNEQTMTLLQIPAECFIVKCALDLYGGELEDADVYKYMMRRFRQCGFNIDNEHESQKRYACVHMKNVVFADSVPDGFIDCGSNYPLFELLSTYVNINVGEQFYKVLEADALDDPMFTVKYRDPVFYWLSSQTGCEPYECKYVPNKIRKATIEELVEYVKLLQKE